MAKAFELFTSKITVSSQTAAVKSASHIVLPGVGAFADCMAGLSALPGMLETLREEVLQKGKNFLGICVGMQMLFEEGHEHGIHNGLGWLKGKVIALSPHPSSPIPHALKIPHMGWNDLNIQKKSPLLAGIASGEHAYFVHSYHATMPDDSNLLASTSYGENIAAVVGKDNIYGTQFHPEKSQKTGLRIIENFVKIL